MQLLLAASLMSFSPQEIPSQKPAIRSLDDMRDHYRPVLIFTPPKDSRLSQQLGLLTEHRAELIDRQIVLVLFPNAWAGVVDGEIMTFLNQDEQALRHRFRIPPEEFTVILLGKDGTEKLRSHTPVTGERLNRVIDAMPMRQEEMRSRQSAGVSRQ